MKLLSFANKDIKKKNATTIKSCDSYDSANFQLTFTNIPFIFTYFHFNFMYMYKESQKDFVSLTTYI